MAFPVRLPPDLDKQFTLWCAAHGKRKNEVIAALIRRLLQPHEDSSRQPGDPA